MILSKSVSRLVHMGLIALHWTVLGVSLKPMVQKAFTRSVLFLLIIRHVAEPGIDVKLTMIRGR